MIIMGFSFCAGTRYKFCVFLNMKVWDFLCGNGGDFNTNENQEGPKIGQSMVTHLLTSIIALLWLLHRATRLLKIPAPVLINILGIDIPDAPKVTIDNVTSTSVSLHWNPPERASSIVKYILQVDGRKGKIVLLHSLLVVDLTECLI